MTQYPLQYAPPPPRWLTTSAIIAWIIILLSASLIVIKPRFIARLHSAASANQPLPSIESTRSTQLEMAGRLLVASRAFDKSANADPKTIAKAIAQIESTAHNPIDQFRAIPVIGEIAGNKAALDRLDQFEKNNKVVRLREDVDLLRTIYTSGPDHLTPQQSAYLVQRQGWFGELAVSHGLPADSPLRRKVTQPAVRALIAGIAAFLLVIILIGTGIALHILGIIFYAQGKLRPAYQPIRERSAPLVEGFALYLAGMLGLSLLLNWLIPQGGLDLTFILFALLPVMLIYLRLRGLSWSQMFTTLGWHRGRGVWREIGTGIVGYIAGLPLLALGMLITYILMSRTGTTSTHPIINEPINGPWDIAKLFLLASVGAPIIEETMFRGALFAHLRAKFGWWISALAVSLLFAAIHPQGWVAIPLLGSIAMILAALREWRGSLVASMTAHALNNAAAVLMLVLMTA